MTRHGKPIIYDMTSTGGAAGAYIFQLSSEPKISQTPANDNFLSASILNGNTGSVSGINGRRWPLQDATKEPNEPDHGGNAGASLWWSFTAPANGALEVKTYGSDFDATLGVYTGGFNALTLVQGNNNSFSSNCPSPQTGVTQSCVALEVTQGTTYYIAVNCVNGQKGEISLQ